MGRELSLAGSPHRPLPRRDVVDYTYARRRVIVNLTTGSAFASGRTDTLVTVENVNSGRGADLLTGDGAANVLRGGAGNDVLQGLAGDDTLSGGRGRDRLVGLAGNDRLRGGPGTDTADYTSFFSANLRVGVIVDLARGQAAGDGTDSLAAIENVLGSSFHDRLFGNRSSNRLIGSAGNDLLDGHGGEEALHSDAGSDVFHARDGRADTLVGGSGRDSARLDKLDRSASVVRRLVSARRSARRGRQLRAARARRTATSSTRPRRLRRHRRAG